jgi:hypothetical protein
MTSATSSNVRIYFSDGLPEGYDLITGLTVTPTFTSITPGTASAGGNLFTVTGNGFGVNTEGIELKHVESGNSFCNTVEVTEYGVLTCDSIQQEILPTDTF